METFTDRELVLKFSAFPNTNCRSLAKIVKIQGINGSALNPAFVPDTNYMVEKTSYIAPYLGAFGAYLMPQ